MSDLDGLLAAVLTEPECDTARLVVSDWYEENGQADRAEFIRLQIALAKLPQNPVCTSAKPSDYCMDPDCELVQKNQMTWRAEELWADHRLNGGPDPWFGGKIAGIKHNALYLSTYDKPVISARFRRQYIEFQLVRGFIGRVKCDVSQWHGIGRKLVARYPIRDVHIYNAHWHPHWRELTISEYRRYHHVPPEILVGHRDEKAARKSLSDWLIKCAMSEAKGPVPA